MGRQINLCQQSSRHHTQNSSRVELIHHLSKIFMVKSVQFGWKNSLFYFWTTFLPNFSMQKRSIELLFLLLTVLVCFKKQIFSTSFLHRTTRLVMANWVYPIIQVSRAIVDASSCSQLNSTGLGWVIICTDYIYISLNHRPPDLHVYGFFTSK